MAPKVVWAWLSKSPQIEKFRQAAREAEADESEHFNENLERLAKHKPKQPEPKGPNSDE